MRWLISTFVMLSVTLVSGGGHSGLYGQSMACLHGSGESPEQAARRRQALQLVRAFNTAQQQGMRTTGAFTSIVQSALPVTTPDGFALKAVVTSREYAYTFLDQTDVCGFGYFGNESGLIYQGEALR
jgi:hypothetical protein